jgi:hypothetical protein
MTCVRCRWVQGHRWVDRVRMVFRTVAGFDNHTPLQQWGLDYNALLSSRAKMSLMPWRLYDAGCGGP